MIRLEDCKSPFGIVTIFRRILTGAVIYDQFGSSQSEADRNGVSLASYIHAIYDLILQARAQTVLMIGCGGGTLGTMLVRAGRKVTIVDVNPDAFILARRYFGLPEEVVCHVEDGQDFLAAGASRFDAIVLDAFHGDHIPSHLRSRAFFQLARERLDPRGCLFANVHVQDDQDGAPGQMAECALDVWPDVRLLDSPGWTNRNAIVMAGNVEQLKQPTLSVRPLGLADELSRELDTMNFSSWKIVL
ncbi:MAG TPA: fused MFS/spermidine synthase [Rhizomicrobium sp.]|nr:fused MFS/spermidine synthase [Rhizomicrobium sp.]